MVLLNSLLGLNGYAQNKNYKTIDVNNGLPSNYVYRSIEDHKGFLWIATDAGLVRFDGKHSQLYTTKQGLPDNVVLALAIEKNGRIWVNCFKQSPVYFDEVKNRFIEALDKKSLANMANTQSMVLFPLKKNGVIYYNSNGSFIFRDKKRIHYKSDFKRRPDFLINENEDGTQLRWGKSKGGDHTIYQVQDDKLIDSLIILKDDGVIRSAIDDGKFYLFNQTEKKCYIFSDFKTNPLRFKADTIHIPEPYYNESFSPTRISFISLTGKIYVYDKNTLGLVNQLSGDYLTNSYYNDSKGNELVSTIDKGLVVYKKTELKTVKLPRNYHFGNFLSLASKDKETILAGNYYGDVIEIKNEASIINKFKKITNLRTRKIIVSGKEVFTFSDQGIFTNYIHPVLNPHGMTYVAKAAISYSDSVIIVGMYSGLLKLNIHTKKLSNLEPQSLRITAMAKANENFIYLGSNDGLYKYDVKLNKYASLKNIHPLLSDRVTALCTTKDNLTWVGTANSIIVLKNDKFFTQININSTSRNIIASKPGNVWIATPQGINKINYSINPKSLKYTIQNISAKDGLSSNEVQELLYKNDKIYAATSEGITVIPENFIPPIFDIPVYLVRMRVNQRDTIIAKSYHLNAGEQNVQMQFAGVDLSGHFKHFQYTLDKNENWVNLDENTLTIQLNSGEYNIQVRAIDVNGNISNQVLTIKINIKIPFWKRIWFWISVLVIFQIFLIWFINLRQKKRKGAILAKKLAAVQTAALEQQAFTSLMNPHFMFNALNSIQHYINVQDRQNANHYLSDFASLIRKNFEAAQNSFIPLEEEVENIKLYLNLEQMRFDDHFTYKVLINNNLEVEDWMIPTMILQPLLENALLHGIMPSNITGKVSINFKLQANDLLIVITDNGIGLINSNVLKTNTTHKSRGMELIRKRIKALNSFDSQPITIIMEPAFKSKKNPGNKISFLIPATLHQAWLKVKNS
ncbi:MAG: histidine kinase [Pedobacter sp.]|nr:histidine kinase [Pedobacter sp.]